MKNSLSNSETIKSATGAVPASATSNFPGTRKSAGRSVVEIIPLCLSVILCTLLWGGAFYKYITLSPAGNGSISIVESPEQEGPMQHPDFVVEDYEPVIVSGTNITEEAKIEADAFNDVYTPRKVKDGKVDAQSYWEGAADNYPNYLYASFKEEKTIHAIKLLLNPIPAWSTRLQNISVEYKGASGDYKELIAAADYEFDPARNNEVVLEFDPVTITSLRLTFNSNTGATGGQLAELEIYDVD